MAHCWALLDTEHMLDGCEVILRPEIPIVSRIPADVSNHLVEVIQESSILKYKWYLQGCTELGLKEVSSLQEKISGVSLWLPGIFPKEAPSPPDQ